MDNLDLLQVRFYLGGEFVHLGNTVSYVGGDEAMSNIERDKVSLPEIVGHLKDHMIISDTDKVNLHWLFPGKELNNGLQMLCDDSICIHMSQSITEGGVADIYAEVIHEGSEEEEEESNYEDELEGESEEEIEATIDPSMLAQNNDLSSFKAFYRTPEKSKGKNKDDKTKNSKRMVGETDEIEEQSDDSDWWHGDGDGSEDDEEAIENRRNAMLMKKGVKRTDDVCQAIVTAAHHVENAPINDDVDAAAYENNEAACLSIIIAL